MSNPWSHLFALAASQRGVVTLREAEKVGLTAGALRRRASREGWVQLFRGAWLVPGAPATHAARCHAALLLCGQRSVISHESAGFLHGLIEHEPDVVHTLLPADRQLRSRPGLFVHRSRVLSLADLTTVDGLRATNSARTLRDITPLLSQSKMLDLATQVEQRRQASLEDLVFQSDRRRPAPGGSSFARTVAARAHDRSDSGLERDTRGALAWYRLIPYPAPFPVRCPDGRVIYLDIAFPAAWFAIECDGRGFHSDSDAFERDRLRWQQAQRIGWRLTWVTAKRLREDLAGIIEEVTHHLATAPDRAPAVPAV